FALVADQQRGDETADLADLRQDAFHVRIDLKADRQRNRLVGNVDLNILLFAVIEEVKLLRLQAIYIVSVAIGNQYRRRDFRYGRPSDDGEAFRCLFRLGGLLRLLRRLSLRSEHTARQG